MPRNENALAIVNAAFNIKINSTNTIQEAKIIFGNIAPAFTHASKTEQFLIGKNVYNNSVLQGALKVLSGEIWPEDDKPKPSPECRKKLAIGLFYKVRSDFNQNSKLFIW